MSPRASTGSGRSARELRIGYPSLRVAIRSYPWLPVVTRGYHDSSANGYIFPRMSGPKDEPQIERVGKLDCSPTSQWERQSSLTHGRYNIRRLASGLHASAATPADRRVGPAARRSERRSPPPPVSGWFVARRGAHTPTVTFF